MAVKLNGATESTDGKKSKYFLNLYATNKAGKQVKVGMTTLDWNLEKGSAAAKAFTKGLIEVAQKKGGQVKLTGLTCTFVIANTDDEGADEDFDLENMIEE